MKLKYPAEAFAFGILLFSAGMKEAFTAGVLVILSVAFAEFIKNLLENVIPAWSLKACVLISTAAVTSSVFLLGFAFLGDPLTVETWVMTLVVGLLSAKCVLMNDLEGDYRRDFLGVRNLLGLLGASGSFAGICRKRKNFRKYDPGDGVSVKSVFRNDLCFPHSGSCVGIYQWSSEEKMRTDPAVFFL